MDLSPGFWEVRDSPPAGALGVDGVQAAVSPDCLGYWHGSSGDDCLARTAKRCLKLNRDGNPQRDLASTRSLGTDKLHKAFEAKELTEVGGDT